MLSLKVHAHKDETKGLLLGMALRGEKRPKDWDNLGSKLKTYITKSSASYDEDFRKEIIAANPKWFPRLKD